MPLTAEQRRLLRRTEHLELYRDDRGRYWLHPREPKDLPEQVPPSVVEPLIDVRFLVVDDVENVWLGHRITHATAETGVQQ